MKQKQKTYYGLLDKTGKPMFKTIGLQKDVFSDLHHHFIRKSWLNFTILVFWAFILINIIFAFIYNFIGGIEHAESIYDHFFFSIQTLGTIGYGFMYPSTKIANFLVSLESFFGMLFTAFLTGLVYSKFSLPRSKVSYTEKAVVSFENEHLCVKFRMANKRDSQILDATLKVSLIKTVGQKDGSEVRKIFDMKLLREAIPTFVLTFTATHIIDEYSPFYGETHQSLVEKEAMIAIMLTGIDEITSQTIHSKNYYIFDDIMWNSDFKNVMFKDEFGQTYFDYRNFNELIEL